MKLEFLAIIADKLLDKALNGALDSVADRITIEKIKTEYDKLKIEIYERLLLQNKEEPYFEELQKLLEESGIINVLFNFSYLMKSLSMEVRKSYIDNYINNFFEEKHISVLDLQIIKGKIQQQFLFCFEVVNEPSEESRKIINHIIIQIAKANENQTELLGKLKCNHDDLSAEIEKIHKLFPTSDVDLGFLHSLVKMSIDNLGVRFNREFNVDVNLSNWMRKFCIDESEKRLLYLGLKDVQVAISRIKFEEKREIMEKWNALIENILEKKTFDPSLLNKEMDEFISRAENAIRQKCIESKIDFYRSNEFSDWRYLANKNEELSDYRRALCADTLLVTGDAGIGKSHSIAKYLYENYYLGNNICVFLLGQNINERENPILQIEELLHIPYTLQRFLKELNLIAEENNCIVPFVVEGINEGYHSEIWENNYSGLLGIFEKYQNVKLVMSIRNTYIRKCLPDNYKERNQTLIIEHRGFTEDPTSAVAAFFDYYGITIPTFPILYSDFYNPLFLHTLCKTIIGSKSIKIEDYSSFTEIFRGFIAVIELNISSCCHYQNSLNLVKKCVDKIIEYSLEDNVSYGISMEKFYEIVGKIVQRYGVSLTDFVRAMIDNGMFYTELNSYANDEENIQFAYEKYHNILSAQYLISSLGTIEELAESVANGKVSKYIGHHGIVEELSILVPEKYGIEFCDLLDDEKTVAVLEPFLNSLVWRNKTTIIFDKTIEIVNRFVIVQPWYFKKLIEKLLIIAPIDGHPLNALFLHKYLSQFSMATRDSFWVEDLYWDTNYSGVLNTMVKLCNKQSIEYSKNTKELISIHLAWSLASTNTLYREEAIKALVVLFQNDLIIAIDTLKLFELVDDGYVKEGLYCGVYGAVLRSQNLDGAEILAEEVFNDIFGREEVYPHIITRAHAKGIIDYIILEGIEVAFEVAKSVPRYNSKWYQDIPRQKEIDGFKFDYKDEDFEDSMYSTNEIISSMATNTGEESSMYGDFGRYIFEGWVDPWKYHFVAQDLSNIVTKQIFEKYGYEYKLHGEFDRKVTSPSRNKQKNERIGKKYQRISSSEMLARLSDNFFPGTVDIEYSTEYKQRHNFSLDRLLNFDEEGKLLEEPKYQVQKDDIRKIFTPYKYEGPWQFNYRGVDPSVLAIKPSVVKNLWRELIKIPDISNEGWASKKSEEPLVNSILIVEYIGELYVVLEMYNTWESKCLRFDEEPKEYFVKAIAMLAPSEMVITTEGKSKLKECAESRDNFEAYNIFGREFYWADAYTNFENQIAKDYRDDEDGYMETGFDYSNPSSYSEIVEEMVSSYAMPSRYIVENLGLRQLEDGKWFDKSEKLICLDTQFDGYNGALLIRKDSLVELLQDKKLVIAWGMYTEKKGNPYYYSTRKITKLNGDMFTEEVYDTEQWKVRDSS